MNTLQTIAKKVRDHYLQRFSEEYINQEKLINHLRQGTKSGQWQWRLETDYNLAVGQQWIGSKDIKYGKPDQAYKMYRHDLVIFRNNKLAKTFMCWPVHACEEDEFIEEDIPSFEPFQGQINQMELEIHPFPWFYCNIIFYPNAEAIKGIMDMWFYQWFFRKSKPDPFLKVIHRLDGPYQEPDGSESYLVDFGTAPPEAFTDFLHQTCRSKVKRILIH
ncbi:MAG TPA: hypothetical protein PLW31_03160 [Bacteroidales bacterium]|nr:hypothetical protein [Bacteroidales bacterium]